MNPSELSSALKRIASKIDASNNPSKELVLADLNSVLRRVASKTVRLDHYLGYPPVDVTINRAHLTPDGMFSVDLTYVIEDKMGEKHTVEARTAFYLVEDFRGSETTYKRLDGRPVEQRSYGPHSTDADIRDMIEVYDEGYVMAPDVAYMALAKLAKDPSHPAHIWFQENDGDINVGNNRQKMKQLWDLNRGVLV